jgi:cobyrinic acid a,c-diamide synthase
MPHRLVSAAHKSSGKTTVSLGLARAFSDAGVSVQPFKKGPDYIDPMWLRLAAGRDCHNLDFYTMSAQAIKGLFGRHGAGADLAIIEGNKGLYDGLDLDGANSNAALAALLGSPVILVIDCQGMTRGVAPLVRGYLDFEPRVRIAGIILNKVGGARHEGKLRAVLAHYTDVPVLGAIPRDERMVMVERHLGLVPSNEAQAAEAKVAGIAAVVAEHVDLPALRKVADSASPLPDPDPAPTFAPVRDVRIGIARDAAFAFYYPGDLEALAAAGAELVFFDALNDRRLPDVDGLFIGGGFPEVQMDRLAANAALRGQVREAIGAGLPVYAECGGLMYLARRIHWQGRSAEMVGAIPADVRMHQRPIGRGYIRLAETADAPWPGGVRGRELAAHEFHYSSLTDLAPGLRYAYRVLRGTGIDGEVDGIVVHNTLACYAHQRDLADNRWAARFVAFVRGCARRAAS